MQMLLLLLLALSIVRGQSQFCSRIYVTGGRLTSVSGAYVVEQNFVNERPQYRQLSGCHQLRFVDQGFWLLSRSRHQLRGLAVSRSQEKYPQLVAIGAWRTVILGSRFSTDYDFRIACDVCQAVQISGSGEAAIDGVYRISVEEINSKAIYVRDGDIQLRFQYEFRTGCVTSGFWHIISTGQSRSFVYAPSDAVDPSRVDRTNWRVVTATGSWVLGRQVLTTCVDGGVQLPITTTTSSPLPTTSPFTCGVSRPIISVLLDSTVKSENNSMTEDDWNKVSNVQLKVMSANDSDYQLEEIESANVSDAQTQGTNWGEKTAANVTYDLKTEQLINGESVVGGRWPWMATLVSSSGEVLCASTILNQLWILTSATCIMKFSSSSSPSTIVRAGAVNFSNLQRSQVAVITTTHTNPSFLYTPNHPLRLENDIALVKLRDPLRFNEYVQRACVQSSRTAQPGDAGDCYIAGWGQTFEQGGSGVLRERKANIMNLAQCQLQHLSTFKWLSQSSSYCVTAEGGAKICKGDTGGPLHCRRSDGLWQVFGVASWSKLHCTPTDTPSVYSQIGPHLDWIQSTCNQCACVC